MNFTWLVFLLANTLLVLSTYMKGVVRTLASLPVTQLHVHDQNSRILPHRHALLSSKPNTCNIVSCQEKLSGAALVLCTCLLGAGGLKLHAKYQVKSPHGGM